MGPQHLHAAQSIPDRHVLTADPFPEIRSEDVGFLSLARFFPFLFPFLFACFI